MNTWGPHYALQLYIFFFLAWCELLILSMLLLCASGEVLCFYETLHLL